MEYQVIDTEFDTVSSTAKTLKRAIFNLSCATGYEIIKEGSKWKVLHWEDDEDCAYFTNTRERAVWEIEYRTGYTIRKA